MWRVLCLLLLSLATARAQGSAVVALQADPGVLNPALSTAGPLHLVADSIFSGLVLMDEAGQPQPDLAETWREEAPGRWRFTLRPDARWHDGKPVTADDVVFSFTEVLFRHHARAHAGLAPNVASITAPDARSVVFALRRPDPAFLPQLNVTQAPILPRHVYEGDPLAARPPVGSGPFRLVERQENRIVLERVAAANQRIARLEFRVIPDPAAQAAALKAGQVDYLPRVAGTEAERLRAAPSVILRQVRGNNCVMTLAFNTARIVQPIRLALARTIDREALLALGPGRVARAPLASGLGAYHAPEPMAQLTFDRAAARAALPAGLGPLDLVTFAQFAPWVEALQADAAAIGLELRPRLLAPAAMAEAVFTRQDFDLSLVSYCQGATPAVGARRMFDWGSIGVPFGNAALYRDAEIQALLARGDVLSWHAIQARAAEDLPYWPLIETEFLTAWRDSITGWAPWSGRFADEARRLR
jgi:peptide/nickel transport system substrate-binding protein